MNSLNVSTFSLSTLNLDMLNINMLFLTVLTLVIYQCAAWLQQKWQLFWLNPMLISMVVLIPFVLLQNISYTTYYKATLPLNMLLEPAIVALGFPLYQQLQQIKYQWKSIIAILTLGIIVVISISYIITFLLVSSASLAVSMSLKSVTTPIAITITEQLSGNSSITAFAIIIAGLSGAILGPPWLNFLKITSPKAQGLAIGTASHVIGTASLHKISAQHSAYSSLALIVSALLTAIISPSLITFISYSINS